MLLRSNKQPIDQTWRKRKAEWKGPRKIQRRRGSERPLLGRKSSRGFIGFGVLGFMGFIGFGFFLNVFGFIGFRVRGLVRFLVKGFWVSCVGAACVYGSTMVRVLGS